MQYKALVASLLATAQATTLPELLASTPDLKQLADLVASQPQIASALGGAQNITVLAPSNAAISKLLASPAAAAIGADQGLIGAILQYHVIQGVFPASSIPESLTFVPTLLNGQAKYANVTGGQRLGVLRKGNGVTVFSGGLQNSTVTTADVKFDGGVVHVIDHVLTLPQSASATAGAAGLTQLASALGKANLVSTVDGLSDVTIFAPNDGSFQRIASALPSLNVSQLTSILTYHVVQAGKPVFSSDLTNGQKVKTIGNATRELTITLNAAAGKAFVNNAEILIPNVLIAGGVVHVISEVLNPADPAPVASGATSGHPSFNSSASGNSTGSTGSSGSGTSGSSTGGAPGGAVSGSTNSSAPRNTTTSGAAPAYAGAGMAALFAGAAVLAF